ncbi:hypothetical protein CEXT_199761, partial [Caerostris extrusa]
FFKLCFSSSLSEVAVLFSKENDDFQAKLNSAIGEYGLVSENKTLGSFLRSYRLRDGYERVFYRRRVSPFLRMRATIWVGCVAAFWIEYENVLFVWFEIHGVPHDTWTAWWWSDFPSMTTDPGILGILMRTLFLKK